MDILTLRNHWEEAIKGKGSICPVCDRWGKIYSRPLNVSMIKSLVWLSKYGDDWVDVPNIAPRWVVRTNQLPTLRWWDLVLRRENDDINNTKFSGHWKISELGKLFVGGQNSIPKSIFSYNGNVVGTSLEQVKITDKYFKNFDYSEVMNTERT